MRRSLTKTLVGLFSLREADRGVRFALCLARARGWGGAAASVEHGIDELEHGTLIGRRQLGDPREALQQLGSLGAHVLRRRCEAEQLVDVRSPNYVTQFL